MEIGKNNLGKAGVLLIAAFFVISLADRSEAIFLPMSRYIFSFCILNDITSSCRRPILDALTISSSPFFAKTPASLLNLFTFFLIFAISFGYGKIVPPRLGTTIRINLYLFQNWKYYYLQQSTSSIHQNHLST